MCAPFCQSTRGDGFILNICIQKKNLVIIGVVLFIKIIFRSKNYDK
ncbi:MAG: hypothetical protein LBR79_00865 [Oscillospiraceae bacterium]|nr:hypothetical protein [Oscillospiraceae bacterium]